MAKFLFEAHYTIDGAKGLSRDGGSARRDAVAKAVDGLGGKLESFYFAFGDVDAYVVVDLPDAIAAAALAISVNKAGGATIKTIALISPEEMDAAARKSVGYRPPGG